MWRVWQLGSLVGEYHSATEAIDAAEACDPFDRIGDGACTVFTPDGVPLRGASYAELRVAASRLTPPDLEWSDPRVPDDARCHLCELSTPARRVPAVTLAIVAGFRPDGGGSAHIRPVCRECARRRNVISLLGLEYQE